MKKAVKFLRSIQWNCGCGGDMNKGQCGFCYGVSKEWAEISDFKDYGHKQGCDLAEALEDLGIRVDYKREFK